MRRKKIVIVTGNDRVATGIEDDVRLILGDNVIIEKLFPPQVAEMEHVEGDLFLRQPYDLGKRPATNSCNSSAKQSSGGERFAKKYAGDAEAAS